MNITNIENSKNKFEKVKLDFKDSKYATEEENNLLQEFG